MSRRRARRGAGPYGQKWLFALGAIALGIILFVRVQDQSPNRFAVLDLSEHPPGSATPYVPEARRFPAFYLVHTEQEQVYAIVRLAPGSGCLVVWDEEARLFQDPCDGHRYDWDGLPLGHDSEALQHLAIERSDIDMVLIDLGHRLPNPNA